ncbi:MAG TPA: glycosyltransferase family 39 protein [Stellaceae bacterium]|nr:glycosyltransferase family 39 protein [Stellaceae bacterium]
MAALLPRLPGGLDRWGRALRWCALPAAIAALAFVLRLHGLGAKPFWLDEITSLRRATDSLHDLTLDALHNRHCPSYFLLLWLVAHFGASEWLLRLPSAIFGAIAAALAALIGRRAAGAKSGAMAGLLMALSPFEVQFGQEARSYTLVSCLILVALSGLVRLARAPAAAALPWREGAPRGAWLAYGLGTAAALSVLNVAVAWFVAANLSACVIAWRAAAARRAFLRRWGLAQALVIAAWAPSLMIVFLVNKSGLAHGADWAPPETLGAIWATLAPVYLMRISDFIIFSLAPAGVPGLSVAVAGLAALGVWRLRRDPAVLAVLGGAAFAAPLGMLLLSPLVPVLVPRYFAWSAAPFFVLAGAGIGGFAGLRFAVLAPALLAACFVNLVPYYRYETKPRWDLLAARIAAKAKPGDVVLVNRGYSYYVFSIFAERAGLLQRGVRLAAHLEEAERLAPGHTLWAVYGRTGQGPMQPPEDYLRSLAPLGRPLREHAIGRYIIVWRFSEPADAEPATPAAPANGDAVEALQP